MAKRELSSQDIRYIEELAAHGFSDVEIGKEFGMSGKGLEELSSKNVTIRGALQKGRDRCAKEGDHKRRVQVDEQSRYFVPKPEDYETIKELSRLGWHEHKIAKEVLNITFPTWISAKKAFPALAEAVKTGQEESNGRRLHHQMMEWSPTPADLVRVEELAAQGKNQKFIARALGLNASTISKRMSEIPELEEAYMRGLARDEELVAKTLRDEAIKKKNFVGMMFYLKARHGWNDRPGLEHSGIANNTSEQNTNTGRLVVPIESKEDEFCKKAAKVEKQRAERLQTLKAVDNGDSR